MKWRPNRKVTFNRWKDCPRCGLSWPEKSLRREPETSALVCSECFDEVSHAYTKAQGELKESTGRQSAPWTPDQEEQ